MKLKLVIVEDEFFAAKHLKRVLLGLGYEVVKVFHSGEAFFEHVDLTYDAAILDIHLAKKMTGLDVAKKLNEEETPFVFLTANKEERLLIEAAQLKPSAYISKPFKENDVKVALEIISLTATKPLRIRTNRGDEFIDPDEILFIKSENAYVEIYTVSKKIVQRILLKELEQLLPDYFVRAHKSYVVNKKKIEAKNSKFLTICEYQIPISRGLKL